MNRLTELVHRLESVEARAGPNMDFRSDSTSKSEFSPEEMQVCRCKCSKPVLLLAFDNFSHRARASARKS